MKYPFDPLDEDTMHGIDMRFPKHWWRRLRLVFGYRGYEHRLFTRGPNWWQITLPPSRKCWRVSLIHWWPPMRDSVYPGVMRERE